MAPAPPGSVVVKVQRPGIAESVDRDLLVLAELARVAETRTAWGADYHVTDLADGRLGLIDFGATGRLDPLQQASMREMLVAVQQRDAGLLRSAVLEVATLRRHFDDDQLERALARFMARHLAAGAAPRAAMFNDLLQLFFAFGINLPPEFSTFFRALVTLEGTLTTLSPGYLVIEAAEQIAAEWARASLAPASLEDLARRELGTQGGPSFTGDTSLFQLFGYFGLFCATVLILRVIVAILRDGLN